METLKDWYRGGDNSGMNFALIYIFANLLILILVSINKPLVGLFGAVAGAASVYGNTPIDVVKVTSMMLMMTS